MKRKLGNTDDLMGWNRDSQLWANISAAVIILLVLGVLLLGVFLR